MMMLMPSILFSGMLYPIESMPQVLQWLTIIVPARWFIAAIRKLMIMGVGLDMVAKELLILSAMATLILGIALKKFNIRLE
jgi:ABC superfamily ATP binding cassette transporter, permease protein